MSARCSASNPKESFGRTYEALEVIEKCFTDEEFTHQGKYFTFRGVKMTTKPVQQPGPRIYIAALGPQSLTRAGERGYSLASMVHTPLYPRFLEAQAAAGRTRADFRLLSGPLAVHVAPTREQAWDEAELGAKPGAVSHVAWTTGNLPLERQHLATAGCPLLTTSVGGAVADWFAGGSLFGHPIEVHQPTEGVLSFWQSLRD